MRLFTTNQTNPRAPFSSRPDLSAAPRNISAASQQAGDALQSVFDDVFGNTTTETVTAQVNQIASSTEASIGTLSAKTPDVVDSAFQTRNPSASPKVPVGDALQSSISEGTPQARFFSTTDSRSEIAPLKFDPSQKISQENIDQTDMAPIRSAAERLNVETPTNDEDLEDFKALTVLDQATRQVNGVFSQTNDVLTGARDTIASEVQDRLRDQGFIEAGTGNIAEPETVNKVKDLFGEFEEFAAPKLNCLPNLGLDKYFDPDIPGFEDITINADILECVGETIDREARNCGIEGVIPTGSLIPNRTIQNMFNTLSCYAVDNNLGSIAENLLKSFKVDNSTRSLLKKRFPEVHDTLDWRSIKAVTGAMGGPTDWPHKDIFLDDLGSRQDIQTGEDVSNALGAANDIGVDPEQLFKRPGFEAGTGNRINRTREAGTGNVLDVWDVPSVEKAASPLSGALIDETVRKKIGGRQLDI